MNKDWQLYDRVEKHNNLFLKDDENAYVDIMLFDGKIINMCTIEQREELSKYKNINGTTESYIQFYFKCHEKWVDDVKEENVYKIRLTHVQLKRYVKHNINYYNKCTSCGLTLKKGQRSKFPCKIIDYRYYPTMHPDYGKNKRVTPTYKKILDSPILFPIY